MARMTPLLIPIIALMIPIVAILTAHQRKMAELIHSRQSDQAELLKGKLSQMEMEMSELRDRLNAATIASDRSEPPTSDHLRLNQ